MKRYILHSFTIFIGILLCLASSCKPEPKKQKYLGTYPLGDIKDYLYFKPGSIWVYECDSTGELDTMTMYSMDTSWLFKPYLKIQKIQFSIKSNTQKLFYTYKQPFLDIPYSENYQYYLQVEKTMSSNGSLDAVFFKPFDTNVLGAGSSPTHYKGLLTNYTVLGKTYDTVRVFKVQATSGFPIVNSWRKANLDLLSSIQYYWAKKVGMVQLKVFAWDRIRNEPFTHNWNLKEYKLK